MKLLFFLAFSAFLSLSSAVPTLVRQDDSSEETCPIDSVCFAMDQSGSIFLNYGAIQNFVIEVAREIESRSFGTLFSAYGFSNSVTTIQTSTSQLETLFVPAITASGPPSGSTNMYAGLNGCFNDIAGQPGNKVIILLTDGQDNAFPLASSLAPVIKDAGITIVTVGIGAGVSIPYLEQLASTPDFFIQLTFSTLPSEVVSLSQMTCDAVEGSPEPSETPDQGMEPLVSETPVYTPEISETPEETVEPSAVETPDFTPDVGETPIFTAEETFEPTISETPLVSESPEPSITPLVSETPLVLDTPEPSETPDVSGTPVIESPVPSETPVVFDTPIPSEEPFPSETPIVSETPVVTETPIVSETPIVTATPIVSETPVVTQTPDVPITPPALDACEQAYQDCDFAFLNTPVVPTFTLGGNPDKPFTPRIVSRIPGEVVGVLNTNGIIPEFIEPDGSVQLITSTPANPMFAPTQFKPLSIPDDIGSGVGYQTFQGNQLFEARNRCVRLFITSFQILETMPPFSVVGNVNADRTDNKCVVFRTD